MNLLYIFADQLHGFGLGCLGDAAARTPHLDALAARGAILRQAYSCAPVCTPARITMWTGQYAGALGTLNNNAAIPAGIPTMAECFRAAGHLTSYVGKWHIGGTGNVPVSEPLRGGFECFAGFQCFNEFRRDVRFFDEQERELAFSGRHRTDATFDLAIERLRQAAGDGRPFLLCVSEQAPHYPCQPDPEYFLPFQGEPVMRRPNSVEVDPYTPTFSPPSPPRASDPTALAYGGNLDEYLRCYRAAVSQLDAGVGRLLAALEDLGLRESTTVIFSSDHGDMQGSHGLINKCVPYEESTRIPLIFAGPDIPPGVIREELASTVDLFPTFADLCGLDAPDDVRGRSLLPVLQGCGGDAPVFSEDASGWCMVRHGRWKLVATLDAAKPRELYDLHADPFEQRNLLDREPAVTSRLLDVLGDWRAM